MYSLRNRPQVIRNAEERAKAHTYNTLDAQAVVCFQRFIALCKEYGLELFVVTTPVTQGYNFAVNREQYQHMVDIVNRAISGYDKGVYLNFFDDFSWAQDEDNFFDADHLSDLGAAKYSKILADTLFVRKAEVLYSK